MNRKILSLDANIRIIISDEFNFTTDSILLADFSSPLPNSHVLEIGSGCGIIPLLWCRNNNAKTITAVEINKSSFDMMSESIKMNRLENKILPINEDIKSLSHANKFHGAFDMIACNPPYYPLSNPCKTPDRTLARCEQSITLEEIIKISHLLLKHRGDLCLCCKIERLCDVIFYMKNHNIEPKLLRLVEYKEGKPPRLFLIKGKKGANPGLICMNNLIVQTKTGGYTNEVKKIYSRIT